MGVKWILDGIKQISSVLKQNVQENNLNLETEEGNYDI
jgi:hypothetical protein